MKKTTILTSVFALLAVSFVNAQTEAGHITVGSSISSLSFSKNGTAFGIAPSLGFFVVNGFAIGLTPSIGGSYVKSSSGNTTFKSTTTLYGVGPFVKFYIGKTQVRPFLYGSFNFSHAETKYTSTVGNVSTETKSTTESKYFSIGGGVARFINNHVSVEAGGNYLIYPNIENANTFQISLGFHIFLGK